MKSMKRSAETEGGGIIVETKEKKTNLKKIIIIIMFKKNKQNKTKKNDNNKQRHSIHLTRDFFETVGAVFRSLRSTKKRLKDF